MLLKCDGNPLARVLLHRPVSVPYCLLAEDRCCFRWGCVAREAIVFEPVSMMTLRIDREKTDRQRNGEDGLLWRCGRRELRDVVHRLIQAQCNQTNILQGQHLLCLVLEEYVNRVRGGWC